MEIGVHLGVCVGNALKEFNNINKCFPKRIIVFRDGIGGAMNKAVNDIEIPGIK